VVSPVRLSGGELRAQADGIQTIQVQTWRNDHPRERVGFAVSINNARVFPEQCQSCCSTRLRGGWWQIPRGTLTAGAFLNVSLRRQLVAAPPTFELIQSITGKKIVKYFTNFSCATRVSC